MCAKKRTRHGLFPFCNLSSSAPAGRRAARSVQSWNNVRRMRLIVVRHGIATAKRRWDGADADRPLTAKGTRQAQVVAARLARYGPTEIFSSPSLRCRQTIEPLAVRTEIRVQRSEALRVDAGTRATKFIHQLVATREPGATIVVCTHREVLVETLPALTAEAGVRPVHRPPGAKGSYWALRFRAQNLVSIKYSRPKG